MNFYGQKLGLNNTHYDSPHGLINKNNVSCASDVAKLIRECMIGGPRQKQRRVDDFTAFQQALTDESDTKDGLKNLGWVQKVYRRVVGTKRYETTAIVPVELTDKEVKKKEK
jgi:D-alanyl-D-alanine carboxypeptidase